MPKLRPILLFLTGTLITLFVTNDHLELLFEFLFGWEKFKLPIEISPGGWKVKFWLMDHELFGLFNYFALFQVLMMGTGFTMIFLGLFHFIPPKLQWGTLAGLILSALWVLSGVLTINEDIDFFLGETPRPFMIAQLISAAALIPSVLHPRNTSKTIRLSLYIGTGLILLVAVTSLVSTPVTLKYIVFPLLGSITLIIIYKKHFK